MSGLPAPREDFAFGPVAEEDLFEIWAALSPEESARLAQLERDYLVTYRAAMDRLNGRVRSRLLVSNWP